MKNKTLTIYDKAYIALLTVFTVIYFFTELTGKTLTLERLLGY